jgi:regulator of sirC expression with transglutaminase-like and TPR domain
MWGVAARDTFARLVEHDDPAPSLAEAALWVAAEEYPRLDVAAHLAKLDRLAQRVERLRAKLLLTPAEALRVALAEEQGFHGNRDDYYDPRNSYLNEVLARRAGIPITLGILYIEVARRVGLPAEGVAFPGHFLVQLNGEEIIDPFHGARVLSSEDCAVLLGKVTNGRGTFTPELLQPVSWRKIIYRLLANLKGIYLRPPVDHKRGLAVIDRMLLVSPGVQEDVRDRGLLAYQLAQKSNPQPIDA